MSTPVSKTSPSTLPDGPPMDIIFHNMHAGSDFRTFRATGFYDIKYEVLSIAKHLENECYEIISMNVSKYSVVVVMSTSLSKENLRAKGFPFPIPVGQAVKVDEEDK